jgi:hypothetical protein
MLFTDRDFINIDDIVTIDSDVAEVAAVENIPTEGDSSFVHQAIEEAASTLEAHFQNFGYNYINGQYTSAQNAMFPFMDSTPKPRLTMGQIVIDSATTTYWSPLKRWAAYLALRNFYQIASNRKIDDKYQAKLKAVQADIDNKYWNALKSSGLPVVFTPIPCPGALYEPSAGTWGAANVTETAGGSATAATWDVAVTWTAGTVESGPSETISIAVDANNLIEVDISSLVVPGPPTSTAVTSWKVYAGQHGKTLYFQTTVPIATAEYVFAATPTLSGVPVGRGQTRDVNLTFLNLWLRS